MSSEYRFIEAAKPGAEFKVFQPRMKDVLYEITDEGNRFLIVTNWNAKNFRLMECGYDHTDSAHWNEVIAHRPDVLLEGVEEFKNFLVIVERKNGLHQLRVRRLARAHEVRMVRVRKAVRVRADRREHRASPRIGFLAQGRRSACR